MSRLGRNGSSLYHVFFVSLCIPLRVALLFKSAKTDTWHTYHFCTTIHFFICLFSPNDGSQNGG